MNKLEKKCFAPISKPQNFWKVIRLFLDKPHTVNKRLAGSAPLFYLKITNDISLSQFLEFKEAIRKQPGFDDVISSQHEWEARACSRHDLVELIEQRKDASSNQLIIVCRLYLKNNKVHKPAKMLVFLDFVNMAATFALVGEDNSLAPLTYSISLMSGQTIAIESLDDEIDGKACKWLENCLLAKLVKWCNYDLDVCPDLVPNINSLLLVDFEKYYDVYNELKMKYGPELVKNWRESTDPLKFVYEDIAIAAYLLVYWRRERRRKQITKLQSFVDLGCGNGLLVYILSSEGHEGYGIDLRKRAIWDWYPKTTKLKVKTIIPSNKTIFPNTDWIIGKHTDELSTWIPVIACRNSFKTNFFVLPCCPFDFDGKEYQRKKGQKITYQDFFEYMVDISGVCGFATIVDRLKIASEQRFALIGTERTWKHNEFDERCKAVENFIEKRMRPKGSDDSWNMSLQARDSVEKVRNCTKIDENVQENIKKIIFDHLLLKKRYVDDFVNTKWNFGGIMALCDLVKIIPADLLTQLNSECGGLQKLLQNNHQIFQVQQGNVQIRKPVSCTDRLLEQNNQKGKKFVIKRKNCWFRSFHPDGCPFSDVDCRFKH